MTIEEAITILGMVEAHGVCIEAKDIAVDIMRKYQKIEKLIDSWELGLIDNIGYEISEVVEDGNEH